MEDLPAESQDYLGAKSKDSCEALVTECELPLDWQE